MNIGMKNFIDRLTNPNYSRSSIQLDGADKIPDKQMTLTNLVRIHLTRSYLLSIGSSIDLFQ
ncbi:hypothetical protein BDE02_01G387700 [Populus trichocarpa]|nr:hypothetical protein BDE02_01G387700 [Populus trichocarpa]